jgi:hypothetical protein
VNWKGLLVAAITALVIAFLGAYILVVSQNPASAVPGPPFVYGSPTP